MHKAISWSNPDIKILRDELVKMMADNKKKDSVIEEQARILDDDNMPTHVGQDEAKLVRKTVRSVLAT